MLLTCAEASGRAAGPTSTGPIHTARTGARGNRLHGGDGAGRRAWNGVDSQASGRRPGWRVVRLARTACGRHAAGAEMRIGSVPRRQRRACSAGSVSPPRCRLRAPGVWCCEQWAGPATRSSSCSGGTRSWSRRVGTPCPGRSRTATTSRSSRSRARASGRRHRPGPVPRTRVPAPGQSRPGRALPDWQQPRRHQRLGRPSGDLRPGNPHRAWPPLSAVGPASSPHLRRLPSNGLGGDTPSIAEGGRHCLCDGKCRWYSSWPRG